VVQDPERAAKDAGKDIQEGLKGAYNKGKDAVNDAGDNIR
jgi:hypothetical protein